MKKVIFFVLAFFIFFSSAAFGAYTGQDIHNVMEKSFLWVSENTSPLGDADSVESDYYVIAMSRANRTFDYNKYKKISRSKTPATVGDAHRIIISNAACDGAFNNTFVGGYTYNAELSATSDLAGALLTLFAGDYDVKSNVITRDDLVVELLASQGANGSFGGDIVATSKGIIALSFMEGAVYEVQGAYKTEKYYYDVNNSILRAVAYLQGAKGADCGFGDINTTAWVIMALDAAGIDCDNDAGFVKDNESTFGWLIKNQNEDGSFGEDKNNTALAVCAITSHIRAMQGKSGFFDVRKNDRIDNPSMYTEEINLSGAGLSKPEQAEVIKVELKSKNTTEAPTSQPIESVIDEEIRGIEKNIKNSGKTKAVPIIIVVTLSLIIISGALMFIFWRMGIKPKRIMRKIKEYFRK